MKAWLESWRRESGRILRPFFFGLLFLCPAAQAGVRENPLIAEVIIADLSNPFFSHLAREVEAQIAALSPQTEVIVRSSGYDLARQQRQIEAAIESGADFLIINVVSSTGMAASLKKAREAGLPVVAIDVDAEGADAVVASDNRAAGRLACTHIAGALEGQGNVLILYGPAVSAVQERNAGCAEVLAEHPGITVLNERGDSGGSRLGGLTYMSSLLPRLPHIDAVFSFNDPTSLGVLQAAREAGRDEFIIVSVDASPEGLEAMSEPGSLLVASVAQYPRAMAQQAVSVALQLWQGEKPEERSITTPVLLVTRDMLVTPRYYWEEPG